MKRTYLIYWDTNKGLDGNVLMDFDKDTTNLKTLIKQILDKLNEDGTHKISNFTIKFMVELK